MAADRKWELTVFAPEIGATKTLLVTGGMMVGEVVLALASTFGRQNWSDHALWWPERHKWLARPRITLQAYGIESDSKLQFTAQSKFVRVQLPDRTVVRMKVNLATECLMAVEQVCKAAGIRRYEELSFMRCNNIAYSTDNNVALTHFASRIRSGRRPPCQLQVSRSHDPEGHIVRGQYMVAGQSIGSVISPREIAESTFLDRWTTNNQDRAFLNGLWYDSAKSLYSQGVREDFYIQLRFKYFNFLDLDPAADAMRIHHLYNQARWAVLMEEVDCTEEEAVLFAAMQLQYQLSLKHPRESEKKHDSDCDLGSALTNLEVSLGLQAPEAASAPAIPTQRIQGMLKFAKGSRFSLKTPKPYFFIFHETTLVQYKDPSLAGGVLGRFNFRGAEVVPDVDVEKEKLCIRAEVQDGDILSDIRLFAETEDEYATWLAACRMASRGKMVGFAGHEAEKEASRVFIATLRAQKGNGRGNGAKWQTPGQSGDQNEDSQTLAHFLPQSLLKKKKSLQQLASAVLDMYATLPYRGPEDAKRAYINTWQALRNFGMSYFVIRFSTWRAKDELLGVAYNRLMRFDMATHAVIEKPYHYSVMRSWNINWEIKEMRVELEDGPVSFNCSSADLKILHEFIGGYIFMSMRKDVHDPVNTELFFKLTGGWEEMS